MAQKNGKKKEGENSPALVVTEGYAQFDPVSLEHCVGHRAIHHHCHSFGLLSIPFSQDDPYLGSLARRLQRTSEIDEVELSTPVPEN